MVLKSYLNLCLATNEANPVRLEEGDRRWVVFKCAPKHVNDQVIDIFMNGSDRYNAAAQTRGERPFGALEELVRQPQPEPGGLCQEGTAATPS